MQLSEVLPETLRTWQQGRLDERRVTAICDATHYLPAEKAQAVQQRVLDRAPDQTLAQLKAALKRAVLHVDPDGCRERHRAARLDRRVAVGEEQEGMASLWALLSASDARSCFQWLTRLAQGCGKDDPRGMDARRADLMVNLLTGTLTYAAPAGDDGTTSAGSAVGAALPQPVKGPTSEKNLMGGCGHDHHAKHAPGWRVRARPDGRIEWITPTGHRYYSDPHDYRPDARPPRGDEITFPPIDFRAPRSSYG